jgi:hypothetical protein
MKFVKKLILSKTILKSISLQQKRGHGIKVAFIYEYLQIFLSSNRNSFESIVLYIIIYFAVRSLIFFYPARHQGRTGSTGKDALKFSHEGLLHSTENFYYYLNPPPPGGTAILPEYIHYYGYYYQVIVQCLST